MGRITKQGLYEERMMFFSLKFSHPEIVNDISSFREMSHDQWVMLLSDDFSFIKYSRRHEVNKSDLIDVIRNNIKCVYDIKEHFPSMTFTVQDMMKVLTFTGSNNDFIKDREAINALLSMTKLNMSNYHLSSIIMNHYNNLDYVMEYFGDKINASKHTFMYSSKIMLCSQDLYNFDDLTNEEITSKFRHNRMFRNTGLECAYDVLLKRSKHDQAMKERLMFCFLCKYDGMFSKYTASRYQSYLFSQLMVNNGSENLVKTLDLHFTDEDIGRYIDPNLLTDFGIDYFCYRRLIKYIDFSKVKNATVRNKLIYQIVGKLESDDMIENVQWETINSRHVIEQVFYYMYDLGMSNTMLDVYARCNKKYVSKDTIRKYSLYRL